MQSITVGTLYSAANEALLTLSLKWSIPGKNMPTFGDTRIYCMFSTSAILTVVSGLAHIYSKCSIFRQTPNNSPISTPTDRHTTMQPNQAKKSRRLFFHKFIGKLKSTYWWRSFRKESGANGETRSEHLPCKWLRWLEPMPRSPSECSRNTVSADWAPRRSWCSNTNPPWGF